MDLDYPNESNQAMAAPAVLVRFGQNPDGRDYVVGDIHGMFHHLEVLLNDIGFDEDCDRLFSVGDLVDRGPHSARDRDFGTCFTLTGIRGFTTFSRPARWGHSSAGRALQWHCRGRRFDPA